MYVYFCVIQTKLLHILYISSYYRLWANRLCIYCRAIIAKTIIVPQKLVKPLIWNGCQVSKFYMDPTNKLVAKRFCHLRWCQKFDLAHELRVVYKYSNYAHYEYLTLNTQHKIKSNPIKLIYIAHLKTTAVDQSAVQNKRSMRK